MIDMSRQVKQSEEVYHAIEDQFAIVKADIVQLIEFAKKNKRQRTRFCVHKSPSELIQQMFIVHPGHAYVRPHKHVLKSESMLVLEGVVDYVTLNEVGKIKEVLQMGDYNSAKPFYNNITRNEYHTLVIRSNWLVFMEVTKGPFVKNDTVFGEWSPLEMNVVLVKEYMSTLNRGIQIVIDRNDRTALMR